MKRIILTSALLISAGPLFAAECTKILSDERQGAYVELVAQLTAKNPDLAEQYAEDIQEKQMAWMADAASPCGLIERMIQDLEANYLNK